MGRTVLQYSHVLGCKHERRKRFWRVLSKEDQEAFDHLFDRAKIHTSLGVYIANPWGKEPILLSIFLERRKMIEEILSNLKEKSA